MSLSKRFKEIVDKENQSETKAREFDANQLLDIELVKQFLRIEDDEDDLYLETIVIPSAIAYAVTRTGIPVEELSNYKDITTALLLLCSMNYDFRNGMASGQLKENPIITTILNSHRRNLS